MIPKTYDRQTARFLAVVGENMPEVSSDIMQGWIENPKALQRTLVQALCPRESAPPSVGVMPVWRKVMAGSESMKDISKALINNGFRMSESAVDILKKVPVAAAETKIELVNISVRELGFDDGATHEQIYRRAAELGLDLIPAELAPQLRLLYANQTMGEWLIMGMEPIIDAAGRPRLFYLERDVDGQWLDTDSAVPTRFWYSTYRWVFSRK